MTFRHEKLNKPYPQTSDIFVVPGTGKIGHRLIEAYQMYKEGLPTPFRELVHAGVVSDWPKGIHSTLSGGVHVLDNIAFAYPDAVILRHEDLIGPQMSDVRNKIRGDLLELCAEKRRYDLLSILDFGLVVTPAIARWVLSNRVPGYEALYLFCSELVVRGYSGREIDICAAFDPEQVSPARLAMDPALIYVGLAGEFIAITDYDRTESEYMEWHDQYLAEQDNGD